MDIKRFDFDYRIAEVMPMLEDMHLYGTKALIRDLKTVVDNIEEIRAKTIDEFAEQMKEKWIEADDLSISSEFFEFVDKIAERLKKEGAV